MNAGSIVDVLAALVNSNVRFVLVGGAAVAAHGAHRMTFDIDLVLDLEPANTRRALQALEQLGYRPTVPVPAERFTEPETRRRWADEKGMRVFSLQSEAFPALNVDLFVEEPRPFHELLAAAEPMRIGDVSVPVASLAHLIEMKRKSGRPLDLEDIRELTRIEGERRRSK